MIRNLPALSTLLLLPLMACSESAPREENAPPPPTSEAAASVTIVSPTTGDEINGPDVTVRLEAAGIRIVPAGDMTEGTGHHHLYLDADLHDPGLAVPAVPGSVIHMGDGSSEYTFSGVAPGTHRLIAVVADGIHVPIQPWVVDTVTFTVR